MMHLDVLWQEKSILVITWIFAIKKGKNKRRLYNKEFAKNFYDSFILIKFGDLKPSWPLAMERYFIAMKINCWAIRIDH